MLDEGIKLSGECSHVWRVSRVASAYPRDFPQVLYSTLQKNDSMRRYEHYSHMYTHDVTCELYCICDLILENRQYPHNFQNAFYLFFVFYRDRGMD